MTSRPKMHPDQVETKVELVRRLLAGQFPQWADLPITPVESYGTDHDIYRLGDHLAARLPCIDWATEQAALEAEWLPKLAPHLPLALPVQVTMVYPATGYPFEWSVYEWLPGENASGTIQDLERAAVDLAAFIKALRAPGAAALLCHERKPRMIRAEIVTQLADRILAISCSHPKRVAIDGIDAAGKTTLANALAQILRGGDQPVIEASLDGFHQPRRIRYQQGRGDPGGYYEDSFDYCALQTALLLPLGPGGTRRYRRAVFDFQTDLPIASPLESAPDHAILLVDGIFLLRPELVSLWDYRIFVSVSFDVALQRAMLRDQHLFGTSAQIQERYLQRYFPAQQMYLEEIRPQDHAHAIVDNDAPATSHVIFR